MSAPQRTRRLLPFAHRGDERGQAIVEFALVVPIFMLLLLSMLEFGFAFDHTLTIQYASREGARLGAALGPGTTATPCANVDTAIIAAVRRVLESPGSRVDINNVSQIRIYKANTTNGDPVANTTNIWVRSGGAFVNSQTQWSACSRSYSTNPPDSIGIAITYTYDFKTPLGGILRVLGGPNAAGLGISDKAVMALNPQS